MSKLQDGATSLSSIRKCHSGNSVTEIRHIGKNSPVFTMLKKN